MTSTACTYKSCKADRSSRNGSRCLETLGQQVHARGNRDSYTGLAEGVDELGNLQLRLEDGRMVTLTAGDVSLSHHQT